MDEESFSVAADVVVGGWAEKFESSSLMRQRQQAKQVSMWFETLVPKKYKLDLKENKKLLAKQTRPLISPNHSHPTQSLSRQSIESLTKSPTHSAAYPNFSSSNQI